MKILFINLPYYGHVVPTIGLVQELIKLGCEVTYLMPFDWEEKIVLVIKMVQKVLSVTMKIG